MANAILGFWQFAKQIEALLLAGFGIIKMPTGVGKTTQCPQLLHQLGYTARGLVLVCVPRRVLAIELARRVAEEMGVPLGDLVGYQIRGEQEKSKNTRILFVTEGMLRVYIRKSPLLEGISAIIFDEFHQRTLMSDFNVALVERARAEGGQCAVLLMSATVDVAKLADHFGCGVVDGSNLETTHPIEERYLDETEVVSGRFYKIAASQACNLLESGKGDGLVFMPGQAEVEAAVAAIEAEAKECGLTNILVLPLHGGLSGDARRAPFLERKGVKVVTVATDIVETGATLPNIAWVVDSGLAKEVDYDPISDVSALRARKVAQDRLKQRRGRCGRVMAGVYVGLFTRSDMEKRPATTRPEILRCPLREVVLTIKALGLSRVGRPIRFIDYPEKGNWKQAKRQLQLLGLVETDEAAGITELGRKAADLGCDPREAAMLLKAAELGCLREVAIAVAASQLRQPLLDRPKDDQERREAEAAQRPFRTSTATDAWVPVEVVRQFEVAMARGATKKRWCFEHYVSEVALRDVQLVSDQLEEAVNRKSNKTGNGKSGGKGTEDNLRKAIVAGLPDRIFFREGRTSYERPEGEDCLTLLGRESVVNPSDKPLAVWNLFEVEGGRGPRRYITSATEITVSAPWLRDAAPSLVEKKEVAIRFDLKQDAVVVTTRTSLLGKVMGNDEEQILPSHPQAARVFARFFADSNDGSVKVLAENREQNRRAVELNDRAGEEVFQVYNLGEFYLGAMKGARNVEELGRVIDSVEDLRLPAFDPDFLAMVMADCPDEINYAGASRHVEYRAPYYGRPQLPCVQLGTMKVAEVWALPDGELRLPGGRLVEVAVCLDDTYRATSGEELKRKLRERLNERLLYSWEKPIIPVPDPYDDEEIPFVTAVYGQCVQTGVDLIVYGTLQHRPYYGDYLPSWQRDKNEAERVFFEASEALENLREQIRVQKAIDAAVAEAEATKLPLEELTRDPNWRHLDYDFRRQVEFRTSYASRPPGSVSGAGEWAAENCRLAKEATSLLEEFARKCEEIERRRVEEAALLDAEQAAKDAAYNEMVDSLGMAIGRLRFFDRPEEYAAHTVAGEWGQWIREYEIRGSIWDWEHKGGSWDQKVGQYDACVIDSTYVAHGRLEVLCFYEHKKERPSFILRWRWTGEPAPTKESVPSVAVSFSNTHPNFSRFTLSDAKLRSFKCERCGCFAKATKSDFQAWKAGQALVLDCINCGQGTVPPSGGTGEEKAVVAPPKGAVTAADLVARFNKR